MLPRLLAFLILLLPPLTGCDNGDSLDQIQERGELRVVTRNSPTTYYIDKSGPAGFEYALAGLLADELGVELTIRQAFSLEDIFVRLSRQEADLAAAGLALSGEREAAYPHSLPYSQLTPQVIYRAGTFRPRELADLTDMSLVVLKGSRHAQFLEALRAGGFPDLRWREVEGVESMELLDEINGGRAQLAIVDSNEFDVQQSLYPRLKVAFDLGSEQDMVWYLPPDTRQERLLERINGLLAQLEADGRLDRLRELHFGHSETVSRIGSHTFARKMRKTLPQYRALIKQVASEYQMDWHLLAAIAYQESHWDPRATSPTGVRGMMMLTLPTAREMGVDNRLDALQSLRGGARYFKNIKRRLPDDIYEPDRTWLALAAYNIGMGHLEDARVLTQRAGDDPHLWEAVMQHLPNLQKQKYYQTVRYGYARGSEAATYVQNIRHYYSILEWQDIPDNQAMPPLDMQDYLPVEIENVALKAL